EHLHKEIHFNKFELYFDHQVIIMGIQKAVLTQMIQDSVLKLCTQHMIFDHSLEIDGIICISPGDESKELVVKMHRTIMKPTSQEEQLHNPSTSWQDSSLN
ncbi:unnamed protein product, partial [Owenia fusiformis]